MLTDFVTHAQHFLVSSSTTSDPLSSCGIAVRAAPIVEADHGGHLVDERRVAAGDVTREDPRFSSRRCSRFHEGRTTVCIPNSKFPIPSKALWPNYANSGAWQQAGYLARLTLDARRGPLARKVPPAQRQRAGGSPPNSRRFRTCIRRRRARPG